MKIIFSFLIGTSLYFGSFSASYAFLNTAKITFYVVDELGNPVENANVGVGFGENSTRKERTIKGVTKSDGTFSASEECNSFIGFNVSKNSYYLSTGQYIFDKKGLTGWEPWNPEVTVVLRKIEDPVPMYARDTSQSPVKIPVAGKDVGFDLILFDWLAPYGKGQVADFYCHLLVRENRGSLDFGYTLDITFPREFDGIQSVDEDLMNGSEFKLPRIAPENGYKKTVSVFIDRKPIGASLRSYKENRSYIFRVRSEVKEGKLKRALYGKIIGDIKFGKKTGSTVFLNFKYYLNPDYTRNLEFDPNRNLFLNLPESERVRIK